jgi:hypothetical protein
MDASGVVLVAPLHHFCSDYFVVVLFSSFFSKELVDPIQTILGHNIVYH